MLLGGVFEFFDKTQRVLESIWILGQNTPSFKEYLGTFCSQKLLLSRICHFRPSDSWSANLSDGQALAAVLNSSAVVTSGHDCQTVYFCLHHSREVNLGDESQKPRKPHAPLFREIEPEAWWMEPWLSPPPSTTIFHLQAFSGFGL